MYKPPHCEEGLAIVKYLVSKGVDHTKRDTYDWLPIHRAARDNNLPLLRYWIEDMHVNPEVTNDTGFTPLYYASDNNKLDAIGYLVICANANPFAKAKVR